MGQFISSRNSSKQDDRGGLILYYHPLSFYSQKVLFVLHEKNIPCTLYEVDVANGEQCSSWFMQMNPKMDVPVLQDDTLVVPSSNQIINYLEANFNGPSLLPKEDRNLLNKVIFLNRKICQIPIGIISLGTFIHPDIVSKPKLPFIGPLRRSFLESEEEMLNRLEDKAKSSPLHEYTLLMKVKNQREKFDVIKNPDEFQKLIDSVSILLIEIEAQLQHQDKDSWLCCNEFTLADMSLGVLLHRLQQLGLEKHFWGNNKKPYLAKYFTRIAQRKAFQKSHPSTTATMKAAWVKLPYSYKVFAVSIPTVVIGILIYNA
ncbi:ganglioside-induced differentiation-associated protein 1 isoform X2 [Sitodiplosis mosellana]|uniref:ganglioside-induced differentiation-associated protein 1 isoform X2 n=1 Tax=Sitodiplosis mosellana TaxID=263140 RepID=UPI0024439DBB|nr:ganglioside-induced differentiation-associated protein 1 isoform X2 [Sitodiplosis mosellana]XP_055313360.1 ganglioside-induced differentiation-associated protein 1 isoform X2 [Sitodiplosis mosellana]